MSLNCGTFAVEVIMPILAINGIGEKMWSRQVVSRNVGPFYCPSCKAEMLFVDANLKVKHFRHRVACECDTEPETVEHVRGKESVYDVLKAYFSGKVEVEDPIGRLKADVHWIIGGKKVAFEIQATNYDPSVFDEKIAYYTRKGYLTVYLFVSDNFCKEVRTNVYSLKEIEKRIFVDKHYGNSVIGGYLESDEVYLPCFIHKLAKGRDGHCESRFIIWRSATKWVSLVNFLKTVQNLNITQPYKLPACNHAFKRVEKSEQKLVRYKETCDDCDKFIRWIPNKEAIDMGLQF
jgi:hypothetical protein